MVRKQHPAGVYLGAARTSCWRGGGGVLPSCPCIYLSSPPSLVERSRAAPMLPLTGLAPFVTKPQTTMYTLSVFGRGTGGWGRDGAAAISATFTGALRYRGCWRTITTSSLREMRRRWTGEWCRGLCWRGQCPCLSASRCCRHRLLSPYCSWMRSTKSPARVSPPPVPKRCVYNHMSDSDECRSERYTVVAKTETAARSPEEQNADQKGVTNGAVRTASAIKSVHFTQSCKKPWLCARTSVRVR